MSKSRYPIHKLRMSCKCFLEGYGVDLFTPKHCPSNDELFAIVETILDLPKSKNKRKRVEVLAAAMEFNPTEEKQKPALSSEDFYWSREWRQLRYRVLKNSNGLCMCCGAGPKKGKPLHVDHIKPRFKFPELELVENNLQVLCADCNIGKGAWDQTDWRNPNAA